MITSEDSNRVAQFTQLPHHELQLIESRVSGIEVDAYAWGEGFKPELQPVMCDFDIVKHDHAPARFFVSLILEMPNSRNAKDVLSFAVTSVTEFEFRPDAVATPLPEDDQFRWQLFTTAVATAISMMRGHLTNFLAPTVYRGYYLPMLKVNELVNKRYGPSALPPVPSTAPSEKPPLIETQEEK